MSLQQNLQWQPKACHIAFICRRRSTLNGLHMPSRLRVLKSAEQGLTITPNKLQLESLPLSQLVGVEPPYLRLNSLEV